MSDDLIRRMDAVQACQVGPSDEWSRSTKSGYNQAATDCAMNILKIPRADLPPTLSAALEVPEVAAMWHALLTWDAAHRTGKNEPLQVAFELGQLALAAMKGGA